MAGRWARLVADKTLLLSELENDEGPSGGGGRGEPRVCYEPTRPTISRILHPWGLSHTRTEHPSLGTSFNIPTISEAVQKAIADPYIMFMPIHFSG